LSIPQAEVRRGKKIASPSNLAQGNSKGEGGVAFIWRGRKENYSAQGNLPEKHKGTGPCDFAPEREACGKEEHEEKKRLLRKKRKRG